MDGLAQEQGHYWDLAVVKTGSKEAVMADNDFRFRPSGSPVIQAMIDAPLKRKELELKMQEAERERKRQRLSDLLTNLSNVAVIGRQVQALRRDGMMNQQMQQQMQGQQDVQGILGEPAMDAPVSRIPMGPQGRQPIGLDAS